MNQFKEDFIDLTNVFDCVNHDTSLSIINFYYKLAKLMNESYRTSGIGTKVSR